MTTDIPSSTTTGDPVKIEGSVTPRERFGDHEAEIAVTLYVDSEQIHSRTVPSETVRRRPSAARSGTCPPPSACSN